MVGVAGTNSLEVVRVSGRLLDAVVLVGEVMKGAELHMLVVEAFGAAVLGL